MREPNFYYQCRERNNRKVNVCYEYGKEGCDKVCSYAKELDKKLEEVSNNSLHVSHGVKKERVGLTNLAILLGFILCFMVNFAPAVSANLGTFKPGDCVPIRVLANCSVVNLTEVTINNQFSFEINKPMTKLGGQTFNYTFCNTSAIGTYTYSWNNPCVDCSQGDCGNDFSITKTGTKLETSQAIIYFIFLIVAIGIFYFCIYYAIKIPYRNQRDEEGFLISVNNLKYVKILLIAGCYLLALLISGLLSSITSNFIPEIGISGFFNFVFWILFSFVYPIMIGGLIFTLIKFLSDKKLTNALEKGIPI